MQAKQQKKTHFSALHFIAQLKVWQVFETMCAIFRLVTRPGKHPSTFPASFISFGSSFHGNVLHLLQGIRQMKMLPLHTFLFWNLQSLVNKTPTQNIF